MIPLSFGLWWSGSKLSYLRYLTFKTLRHFHPDSKIQLFVGGKCRKDRHKWNVEKQDFEDNGTTTKDYLGQLKEIGVEVVEVDWFSEYAPNFQSDLFRWHYLGDNGGFYLDTDQIILKSFKTLPLDNDFIYSGYKAVSCGYYTPVGVLGASTQSKVVGFIRNHIFRFINQDNYNSAGPFMLRDVLNHRKFEDKIFNTPSDYFYPIPESYLVEKIYKGDLKITDDSFAAHWFGGHPKSQEFNKVYTEEFAKKSNDTISVFLREKNII